MAHPRERFTRRDFLARSAATAAGIPFASALLAACGKPGQAPSQTFQIASPQNPVSLPIHDDNQPIGSDLEPEKGATLKLYNWDQYVYKVVVQNFCKQYDCDYEISTFNNMDEALNKIRSAPLDFDIFFPTTDVLGKMAAFNLIQPINHDYVPNLKNVWPEYSDPDMPYYDVGQRYTVPYAVYTTGIGWRNDLVDEKDWPSTREADGRNPYDALWESKYKGKVGVYDDYREAIGMALLRNGGTDINTADSAELGEAKTALIDMIDKVNVGLSINGAYEELPKGVFEIHQAWSGDIIAAPYYGKANAGHTAPLLSYWWPKDKKGVVGNDCIAILKTSKNPVLAHLFLNYMLDFDNAMKNFSWVGYQMPQNDAPPEAFGDPGFRWNWIVYPNLINTIVKKEDFDKGYILLELPPDVDSKWHDNWEEFTSGV